MSSAVELMPFPARVALRKDGVTSKGNPIHYSTAIEIIRSAQAVSRMKK